jgi:diguanylate cyclase (GGDEF)-like protein
MTDIVALLKVTLTSTSDPIERARMLMRTAWARKSAWNLDASSQAAAQGMAELGYGLPRSRVLLALSAIWGFIRGKFVETTGIGFGSATGEHRRRLEVLANLLTAGTAAAAQNAKPAMAIALILRGLYPMARLGPSSEYVRYCHSRALIAEVCGLPGRERSLARTDRAAALVATPEALALARFSRDTAGSIFRKIDDVALLRTLTEVGHLLPVEECLDGLGAACLKLLHRGKAREARIWYDWAAARLGAADLPDSGIEMMGLATAAALGRSAEVKARLRYATEHPEFFATPGMWINTLVMTAAAAVEQRDHDRLQRIAADFAAGGWRPRMLVGPQRYIYATLAYGMLDRCHAVPADERAAAVVAAEQAVAALRRVPADMILTAHTLVTTADLHLIHGDPRSALTAALAADAYLIDNDVPIAAFELARIRARACAELGRATEATGYALFAVSIADQCGWTHRAGWLRAEFSLSGAGSSSLSIAAHTSSARYGESGPLNTYARRLAALEQLSLAASRIVDPAELTRVALDQIIQILTADRAFLFLTEGDDAHLIPHLGRDAGGHDLAELTEYGSTLVERVRTDREPLVVTGSDEGAALGSLSAVVHGLRSIMVAPLLLEGRLIGVVYLDSRVAKGMFTASDVGTLAAITTHVAAALETARAAQLGSAVQAARQQLQVAETMREAMSELAATLDPPDVLNRLRATVARVLPADAAGIFTLTDNHLTRLPEPGEPPTPTMAVGPGAALDLLPSSAPVTGTDPTGAELLGLDPASMACWLAVPLRTRDTLVGLLMLTSTRPQAFGAAETELAAALTAQGMVAYDNARLFAELRELAVTDGLTGLYNARHFFALADTTFAGPAGRIGAVSAVMLDIDHFKKVNDTYGHPVGDQVIKAVAARLARITREGDLLARYGGEEFALLLTAPPDLAAQIAERIRAAIADTPIDTDAGPLTITVSVGVAHRIDETTNPGLLLKGADQALYVAKGSGRNRVSVH